jgi:hypothetical protein
MKFRIIFNTVPGWSPDHKLNQFRIYCTFEFAEILKFEAHSPYIENIEETDFCQARARKGFLLVLRPKVHSDL